MLLDGEQRVVFVIIYVCELYFRRLFCRFVCLFRLCVCAVVLMIRIEKVKTVLYLCIYMLQFKCVFIIHTHTKTKKIFFLNLSRLYLFLFMYLHATLTTTIEQTKKVTLNHTKIIMMKSNENRFNFFLLAAYLVCSYYYRYY